VPDRNGFDHIDPGRVVEINEAISLAVEHHVTLQMRTLIGVIREVGDRTSRLLWAGAIIALLAGVFVGVSILRWSQFAERNRLGIRVNCLVLTDKLYAAGAAVPPKGYKLTEAAKASRRNQGILVGIVTRDATPGEKKKLMDNNVIIAQEGGPITAPDCEDVARNPERVAREYDFRGAQPASPPP
jgi:hypothetical protein